MDLEVQQRDPALQAGSDKALRVSEGLVLVKRKQGQLAASVLDALRLGLQNKFNEEEDRWVCPCSPSLPFQSPLLSSRPLPSRSFLPLIHPLSPPRYVSLYAFPGDSPDLPVERFDEITAELVDPYKVRREGWAGR